MKVGAWNIRGVCRPFKQKELRAWIQKNLLFMVGVLETRVRASSSPRIINSILPAWQSISNYTHNPNGRIWLLWDPTVFELYPLWITDQLIHAELVIVQKQIRFFITYSYGLNCYIQRRKLQHCLCEIAFGLGSAPWLTLGDFNVVRYSAEKLHGDQSWPSYMEEFNECCRKSSLDDLRYTGQFTTWSKGSGGDSKPENQTERW